MIYEFPIPNIIDTKNIFKTFTKKALVDKNDIPKIKKISQQRKEVKETLKYLNQAKIEETIPYNLIDEVIIYAESAAELGPIYQKEYMIHKNFKWSPVFSNTKILKFSKTIMAGKSAEIIMARYAAFAVCFRPVKQDIAKLKQNIFYKQVTDLHSDMTFSTLMKPSPITESVQASIHNILKAQVKAWIQLKKSYERSETAFKVWSQFSERTIEMRPVGMQIALLITKINANSLYIEFLRLHGNYEEMGKYAKMIVTQAVLAEHLLRSENFYVDPKIHEFLRIAQFLYKAIALWSLFFPYMARVRTDTYEDGEDINILAGGCYSFVMYIGELHKMILSIDNIKGSFVYPVVSFYFKDVLISKSQEALKAYEQVFNGYQYNEFHFNRMEELDYMSRTTGDES